MLSCFYRLLAGYTSLAVDADDMVYVFNQFENFPCLYFQTTVSKQTIYQNVYNYTYSSEHHRQAYKFCLLPPSPKKAKQENKKLHVPCTLKWFLFCF
jgi:hypothetical protein